LIRKRIVRICNRRRFAVPAVRRIVVGVHGSLGSLQALRYAADEARRRDVPLVPVIAWLPPGGDLAERRSPSPYLRKVWVEAAWNRLRTAFDDGLGGIPRDIRVEPHVVRGETGPVLVDIASATEDLLIIGTGRRSWSGRLLRRSAGRYCLAHASCPVLAVPPSALMDEMSHGLYPAALRSWQLRRHAAHGFR
jgi:nucleotide-binding universal stress UspA family protein